MKKSLVATVKAAETERFKTGTGNSEKKTGDLLFGFKTSLFINVKIINSIKYVLRIVFVPLISLKIEFLMW